MPVSPAANLATVTPDAELIADVLRGHTARFEVLMRRYNERIYRAARAIVRNEDEAEDVMQQAYVNAFTHLHQFNGSALFSTWLTRIAINESLARVRRRVIHEVFDEQPHVVPTMERRPADSPERQAFTRELEVLLESAIDTLPDGMREVFVLREVEGLSTAETSRPRCPATGPARTYRGERARCLQVRTATLRSHRCRRPRAHRLPIRVTCHLSVARRSEEQVTLPLARNVPGHDRDDVPHSRSDR
jgi:RNA polymerase sigma factor (sigma-70 family)